MKSTKIILFSGFARNGKDQSATFLKEELEKSGKTVVIYHFADALKSLCESSYNWIKGDKGPIGRTILQNVGTAYRKNNPECWVNIARQIALGCSEEYMLIPDCRYKNEALGFLDFDYKNVRIERPNFDNGLTKEQKAHISETEMCTFPEYDYIITNDGSLDDLREKVKQTFQLEVESCQLENRICIRFTSSLPHLFAKII